MVAGGSGQLSPQAEPSSNGSTHVKPRITLYVEGSGCSGHDASEREASPVISEGSESDDDDEPEENDEDEDQESSESESDDSAESSSGSSSDDSDDSDGPSTPRSESEWQYPEDQQPIAPQPWTGPPPAAVVQGFEVSSVEQRRPLEEGSVSDAENCTQAQQQPGTRSPALEAEWADPDLDEEVIQGRWSPHGSPYLVHDLAEGPSYPGTDLTAGAYAEFAVPEKSPSVPRSREHSAPVFHEHFPANVDRFAYREPAGDAYGVPASMAVDEGSEAESEMNWEEEHDDGDDGDEDDGYDEDSPEPEDGAGEDLPMKPMVKEGEWYIDGSWYVGERVLRATLGSDGRVMGSEKGTVVGWLPVAEADFVSEQTNKRAALWHILYDAAYMGEEDLEEFEVVEALLDFEGYGEARWKMEQRAEGQGCRPKPRFVRWFQAERQRLLEANPRVAAAPLFEHARDVWGRLPAAIRDGSRRCSAEDLVCRSSDRMKGGFECNGAGRAEGGGRMKQEDPFRPRSPPSAFELWFAANKEAVREQQGQGQRQRQRAGILGSEADTERFAVSVWGRKPAAVKAVWLAKHHDLAARHRQALHDYEAASPPRARGEGEGRAGGAEGGGGGEGGNAVVEGAWWDESEEESASEAEAIPSALPEWFRGVHERRAQALREGESAVSLPAVWRRRRPEPMPEAMAGHRQDAAGSSGVETMSSPPLTPRSPLSPSGWRKRGRPRKEAEGAEAGSGTPAKRQRVCLMCGRAGHYQKKCPNRAAIEAGTYEYPWEERGGETGAEDGGEEEDEEGEEEEGVGMEGGEAGGVHAAGAGHGPAHQPGEESAFVMVVQEEWRLPRGFRLFEVEVAVDPDAATRAREWYCSADLPSSVLGQQKFVPQSGRWRQFAMAGRAWLRVQVLTAEATPARRARAVQYKQIVGEQQEVTRAYEELDRRQQERRRRRVSSPGTRGGPDAGGAGSDSEDETSGPSSSEPAAGGPEEAKSASGGRAGGSRGARASSKEGGGGHLATEELAGSEEAPAPQEGAGSADAEMQDAEAALAARGAEGVVGGCDLGHDAARKFAARPPLEDEAMPELGEDGSSPEEPNKPPPVQAAEGGAADAGRELGPLPWCNEPKPESDSASDKETWPAPTSAMSGEASDAGCAAVTQETCVVTSEALPPQQPLHLGPPSRGPSVAEDEEASQRANSSAATVATTVAPPEHCALAPHSHAASSTPNDDDDDGAVATRRDRAGEDDDGVGRRAGVVVGWAERGGAERGPEATEATANSATQVTEATAATADAEALSRSSSASRRADGRLEARGTGWSRASPASEEDGAEEWEARSGGSVEVIDVDAEPMDGEEPRRRGEGGSWRAGGQRGEGAGRVCGMCKRKKVRCDRRRPCRACTDRGCEAECADSDDERRGDGEGGRPSVQVESERRLWGIRGAGRPSEPIEVETTSEEGGEECGEWPETQSEGSGTRQHRREEEAAAMEWSAAVELEWQREEERLLRERELEELWRDLNLLIDEEQVAPTALRLAWQDAASFRADGTEWPRCGGVNGSIRMLPEVDYACHGGLLVTMSLLHQLQHKYPTVSVPDVYQMAAAAAVMQRGGPEISLRWGRRQVEDPEQCATEEQCASKLLGQGGGGVGGGTVGDRLRAAFRQMGFAEDREVVCMMGAHTLGRAHPARCPAAAAETAYTAAARGRVKGGQSWTREWRLFDNSYFKALLAADADPRLLRLQSDEALVRDPGFRCWVEVYAQDQGLFFADYAATHKKMSELGAQFDPAGGIVVDSVGVIRLD